ncbi:MAG: YIP1 family protein [Anaerolineae bacterium]|nr:YIP1 family protein [Anaerolineae bacterium]
METHEQDHSLSLLIGIIDQPIRTLARVAESPRWRWVWPTLLMLFSIAVYLGVAVPYLQQEARKAAMLQLANMPSAQAATAQARVEQFTRLSFIVGSAAFSSIIGMLVGWVVAAGILYFSSLMAGEDLNFSSVFAIMPWLWIPFALRNVVQAVWVAWHKGLITAPGLSWLVATGDEIKDARNLTFSLLSQMDFFAAWHIVLVYAGLRAITRMNARKAFRLTSTYVVLSLGVRLLPTLIGRAFMPAG